MRESANLCRASQGRLLAIGLSINIPACFRGTRGSHFISLEALPNHIQQGDITACPLYRPTRPAPEAETGSEIQPSESWGLRQRAGSAHCGGALVLPVPKSMEQQGTRSSLILHVQS